MPRGKKGRTDKPGEGQPARKVRRGRGEGSIYRRKDGRWAGEVFLGYSEDGKRLRKVVYGQTQAEVLEKLRTIQLQLHRDGQLFEPSNMLLGDFLQEWLEQIKPSRRLTTYGNYERAVRLHINPEIGRIPLSKLTALHIQRLYTSMANRGYSSNTIRIAHSVLIQALARAVQWDLIQRNPAERVELPRRERSEMKYLTPDQVQRFLAANQGTWYLPFLATAILTGLRLGELTALQWDHVDLQKGSVSVVQTLHCHKNGQYILGEPKTSASRRTVPLPASLVQILRAYRRTQTEHRLQLGEQWQDRLGLVFTREDGSPITPKAAHWALKRALERANLPQLRMHDLRHTYATLLLSQGTHIKVASALLGHSSVQITLDLYSHIIPGMDQQSAAGLDKLVAPHLKAETPW